MYVPIGKLHPRSNFAGILINLNVAAAIKRGKMALSLTNTFLLAHVDRQKIGEYSGKDRVIHFIQLKRDRVQRNLEILEADLHAATEQFKIPKDQENTPENMPSKPKRDIQQLDNSSRQAIRNKRDINYDIKVDVNECLKTIQGIGKSIVSIFSSPSSLDKIQKTVENIAFRTSQLESNFDNYTAF